MLSLVLGTVLVVQSNALCNGEKEECDATIECKWISGVFSDSSTGFCRVASVGENDYAKCLQCAGLDMSYQPDVGACTQQCELVTMECLTDCVLSLKTTDGGEEINDDSNGQEESKKVESEEEELENVEDSPKEEEVENVEDSPKEEESKKEESENEEPENVEGSSKKEESKKVESEKVESENGEDSSKKEESGNVEDSPENQESENGEDSPMKEAENGVDSSKEESENGEDSPNEGPKKAPKNSSGMIKIIVVVVGTALFGCMVGCIYVVGRKLYTGNQSSRNTPLE